MKSVITPEKIDELLKPYLENPENRSIVDGMGCWYRHPDGERKCVAGQLIPDSEYRSDMEGRKAINLPFFRERFSDRDCSVISRLQTLHDSDCYWKNNEENVKRLLCVIDDIKNDAKRNIEHETLRDETQG